MSSAARKRTRKVMTFENPACIQAEEYRTLRTNVQWAEIDPPLRTVLVTSTEQGAGKSTTAVNLAAAFALMGKKTVIVDADMRKPTQHLYFHKSNRIGLSNLLRGQTTVPQSLQETHIEGLRLLPSGPPPSNPAELLNLPRMEEIVDQLKREFEIVIFDTTPVLPVTDAQIIGAKVEGVLFVLRYGKTKREAAKKALAQLEYMKANVIGVVLNQTKKRRGAYKYEA
ncbi:CpsD/CapB family tyrosine-protein kinase [Paenibacillaceae bacterium WGS1546]|uniref:CpsD/CapB family tyrosine-protein kinase n=1 Tax=Cohnella sp. WGS1546 TaxID=3366810 RepID=UPI00372CED01